MALLVAERGRVFCSGSALVEVSRGEQLVPFFAQEERLRREEEDLAPSCAHYTSSGLCALVEESSGHPSIGSTGLLGRSSTELCSGAAREKEEASAPWNPVQLLPCRAASSACPASGFIGLTLREP